MAEPRIGLFFGAGAEVSYGMPLGGTFALDIFRQDATPDKELLREQLQAVDRTSIYGQWLPDRDQIWSFGKREAGDLLESTIEHRRHDLLGFLSDFESEAESFLASWSVDYDRWESVVEAVTGAPLGGIQFSDVSLNDVFQTDGVQGTEIFESDHFSALLAAVQQTEDDDLRDITMAFVELLVACHGKSVVRDLNLSIFEDTAGLDFLEQMPRMFRFELESVGRDTLGLLLDASREEIDRPEDNLDVLRAFGLGLLEQLLGRCFDYRSLIDEHFRYLYTPKANWAKFTRIATFLLTVRRYIDEHDPDADAIANGPGFYHDLPDLETEGLDVHAVGTSNYNTFLKTIIADSPVEPAAITHLNGALQHFYDPYLNKLVELDDVQDVHDDDHLLVPFMLTQSGIKPMTSIEMSARYVDLFRTYRDCDAVAVIGFGFNTDDSHINGIFRSLTDEGVRIFAFDYDESGTLAPRRRRQARQSLRVEHDDLIDWWGLDADRRSNGDPWWERIARAIDA